MKTKLEISGTDCDDEHIQTTTLLYVPHIHELHDALSFESIRITSLADRQIELPKTDYRKWDADRRITVRITKEVYENL